eukprot:gnl/TRDRNA2_/TRDRNA2_196098_c0_seq1.p1 gnl/TRDRNA2_/TRDRNA2_196098_c0~~gnl/TRDRNA2_/TRDRNA2_196098_c0_seq1.p1  ORF type:complete len:502 (+),score=87.33 gnl/TRDRNA2_/TRDRNA2_196098_c0_seq1:74-1507(+)
MSGSEPLLPTTSSGRLSVATIMKMKAKAHKWRTVSHEHALDHGMAMGYRCGYTAKKAGEHYGKDDEGHEGEDGGDLQSNSEAVTNLLNNCLGSGVLAVSFAIKEVGIITGVILLGLSAIMNRYTLLLVLDCCRIAGIETSYNTVGRIAFGAAGRYAVVAIFVLMGFGCLVSYVDASSDAIGGLVESMGFEKLSDHTMTLVVGLLLIPPTYIRSMKSAALLSGIAFIGALVVVACVLIVCGRDLYKNGLPSSDVIQWTPPSVAAFLNKLPTFALVFSIQAGGSIVVSTLKDNSIANQGKVTATAYILVLSINMAVGIPSYLRFLDKTQGDVLSCFDPADPITVIAKVAVLDLVVLSYMFMMIPCRVALLDVLFGKNEAKQEASWTQFTAITTCVNIAAFIVAALVTDLATVLGLVGAVATNSVAWILPAMIFVKVRANPKMEGMEARPVMSLANIPYFLLAGFGFFGMISGLYSIILA